ncbi:hypothetical protein BT96DRAFT_987470 [Gymnopus androsaceus JB14]|uniref:Uncharacterized protein n=1 Tax=Gymnopus androsaceus JB14 TaxID=1447944 RepID=A0A6A4I7Q9_9AGAR|nr:hypothetical protein BT96DRAFT_987470 [Gymnopus androsaceus JB14]
MLSTKSDKIQYASLTNHSVLETGEYMVILSPSLPLDPNKNAKKTFLASPSQNPVLISLISQFGVGLYYAYLVAVCANYLQAQPRRAVHLKTGSNILQRRRSRTLRDADADAQEYGGREGQQLQGQDDNEDQEYAALYKSLTNNVQSYVLNSQMCAFQSLRVEKEATSTFVVSSSSMTVRTSSPSISTSANYPCALITGQLGAYEGPSSPQLLSVLPRGLEEDLCTKFLNLIIEELGFSSRLPFSTLS